MPPAIPIVSVGIDYGTTEASCWIIIKYNGKVVHNEVFEGYPGVDPKPGVTTLQWWPEVDGIRALKWGNDILEDLKDAADNELNDTAVLRRIKLACHRSSNTIGANHRVRLMEQLKALGITLSEAFSTWFGVLYDCLFTEMNGWPYIKEAGGVHQVDLRVSVAVPGDWPTGELEIIRQAATQGVVGPKNLTLAREPEALAVNMLSASEDHHGQGRNIAEEGGDVIFVDSGGGTTCFAALEIKSASPIQFAELVPSESLDTGSEMVTESICSIAESQLADFNLSKDVLDIALRLVRRRFEGKCKMRFGQEGQGLEKGLYVKIPYIPGHPNLYISFEQITKCFDILIDENIAKLRYFVSQCSQRVQPKRNPIHVMLAGGFNQNTYVRTRMTAALEDLAVKFYFPKKNAYQIANGLALARIHDEDIWISRYSQLNRGFWAYKDYTGDVKRRYPDIPTFPKYPNQEAGGPMMYKAVVWFDTKGQIRLTNEFMDIDHGERRHQEFNEHNEDLVVRETMILSDEDLTGKLKRGSKYLETVWTWEHDSNNAAGKLKNEDGKAAHVHKILLEWNCVWRGKGDGVPKERLPVQHHPYRHRKLVYSLRARGTNLGAEYFARVHYRNNGRAVEWDSAAIQRPFSSDLVSASSIGIEEEPAEPAQGDEENDAQDISAFAMRDPEPGSRESASVPKPRQRGRNTRAKPDLHNEAARTTRARARERTQSPVRVERPQPVRSRSPLVAKPRLDASQKSSPMNPYARSYAYNSVQPSSNGTMLQGLSSQALHALSPNEPRGNCFQAQSPRHQVGQSGLIECRNSPRPQSTVTGGSGARHREGNWHGDAISTPPRRYAAHAQPKRSAFSPVNDQRGPQDSGNEELLPSPETPTASVNEEQNPRRRTEVSPELGNL